MKIRFHGISLLALSPILVTMVGYQNCGSSFVLSNEMQMASSFSQEDLDRFEKGAKLYEAHCAKCHGSDVEFSTKRGTNSTIVKALSGPDGAEPNMKSVILTDAEIGDIVYALNNTRSGLIGSNGTDDLSGGGDIAIEKRLILLSGKQYLALIQSVFSAEKLTSYASFDQASLPFTKVDLATYRFSSSPFSRGMDSVDVDNLLEMAGKFSTEASNVITLSALKCYSDFSSTCRENIAKTYGELAFRRPLIQQEILDLSTAASKTTATSLKDKVAFALKLILVSPQTIYRTEIGDLASLGSPSELTTFEIASMLSFLITDGPPDDVLMNLAKSGELKKSDVLAAEIQRLGSSVVATDKSVEFFREYFEYDVERPEKVAPEFATSVDYDGLTKDSDRAIAKTIERAGGLNSRLFEQLMVTDLIGVTSETAPYYNLNPSSFTPGRGYVVSSEDYAGILSHPRWLTEFSTFDHNNIVGRGRFIKETILCGKIPDAPIVDFDFSANPELTMREKMGKHLTMTSCQVCHSQMDPLGYPFEQYDQFGRFRETEKGKPVDTTGGIMDTGDVDGPVADPFELVAKLSQSQIAQGCFKKHAAQYYMGLTSPPMSYEVKIGRSPETFLDLLKGFLTQSALTKRN